MRHGLAVWVLAVQLYATGPVYYWRVHSCGDTRAYTAALLAWADKARVYGHASKPAPIVGCNWWDVPPPQTLDIESIAGLVLVAPKARR